MTLYKCNRAGDLDCCDGCDHAVPHERKAVRDLKGACQMKWCTEWMECGDLASGEMEVTTTIKVRCVRVKP